MIGSLRSRCFVRRVVANVQGQMRLALFVVADQCMQMHAFSRWCLNACARPLRRCNVWFVQLRMTRCNYQGSASSFMVRVRFVADAVTLMFVRHVWSGQCTPWLLRKSKVAAGSWQLFQKHLSFMCRQYLATRKMLQSMEKAQTRLGVKNK